MKVKTKKENEYGMVRLETSGRVMEVMVKEDLLNPKLQSLKNVKVMRFEK